MTNTDQPNQPPAGRLKLLCWLHVHGGATFQQLADAGVISPNNRGKKSIHQRAMSEGFVRRERLGARKWIYYLTEAGLQCVAQHAPSFREKSRSGSAKSRSMSSGIAVSAKAVRS